MYNVRRSPLLLIVYLLGMESGVYGAKIALMLIGVPVVAMWLMSLDSVKYKKMDRKKAR